MSEKPRFIHRAVKDADHPYFPMRRATAQDSTLSFEARGMLAYILSKPDDWRVQPKDLEQQCSRSVVYRILKELIQNGYVKRTAMRDEKHRIVSWDYGIYEEPLSTNQEVATSEGETDLLPRNLQMEKPLSGKTDITDNRETDNKESHRDKRDRRKHEPFYDAIAEVWKSSASGYIVQIRSMMQGKATKGMWKSCNFDPPVTDPEEIKNFGEYAHRRMSEMKLKEMPTASVTVQRWFYDFRTSRSKNIIYDNGYIPVQERKSVLDGVELA